MTTFVTQVSAAVLLLLLLPFLAGIALLIWIADRQSPFYLADRAGRGGRLFRMAKFRTMRMARADRSAITAVDDRRVTALGRFLRNAKLDELPQLINIARGDMAFFGPRPEDPDIVARFYTPLMRKSLDVKPGLLSPGTLWAMQNHGRLAGAADPEDAYAREILPERLAIDTAYFQDASPWARVRLAGTTLAMLLKRIVSAEARE